jgi:hypothetical protein
MTDYVPGSYHFAERTMHKNVEDRVRAAESRRLWKQSRAQGRAGYRFYFRAMAGLGYRLTAWGERLEQRYSTDSSAPVPHSAEGLAG